MRTIINVIFILALISGPAFATASMAAVPQNVDIALTADENPDNDKNKQCCKDKKQEDCCQHNKSEKQECIKENECCDETTAMKSNTRQECKEVSPCSRKE